MNNAPAQPVTEKIPVILATGNPDKVKELRPMLEGVSPVFRIHSLSGLGITADIAETERTLEGNALLKADAIFRLLENRFPFLIVLADDTGLEVSALGGEPGVYSARFAPVPEGERPTYEKNVRHLLLRMKGCRNRTALFRTVIAIKGRIPSGETVHCFQQTTEGTLEGSIATERKGEGGFGYDPVFQVTSTGKTYGEISLQEKNSISHRSRALQKAAAALAEIMNNHHFPATHKREPEI